MHGITKCNAKTNENAQILTKQVTKQTKQVDGKIPTKAKILDLLVIGAGPNPNPNPNPNPDPNPNPNPNPLGPHAMSLLTRLVDDEPDLLTLTLNPNPKP